MKKHRQHGAKWIAIAGPWDDNPEGLRYINKPDVCKSLVEAASKEGLQPYVWGYPWLGREEAFADAMRDCAGTLGNALLDPELGANPTRESTGVGKRKADLGADKLVKLMSERFKYRVCGFSTFGSGVRLKWFPTNAYAKALATYFPGMSFMGGQTYTDDKNVAPSIADFHKLIEKHGGLDVIDLVPNFGAYARVNGKVRAKTPTELDSHFLEFIDEEISIPALIGWAENFMTPGLWTSFSKMADRMERGATCL
jgi:hypothetical protein